MGDRKPGRHDRQAPTPSGDAGTTALAPLAPAHHSLLRLQRTAGNHSLQRALRPADVRVAMVTPPPSDDAVAVPVQREIGVQIIEGDPAGTIKSVEIVGRPKGYWNDTMGDHTTAFAAHVAGVRLRLAGKTIAQAFAEISALVAATQSLPGFKYLVHLDGYRGTYDAAETAAQAFVTAGPSGPTELQAFVAAYLHLRELVPGSTVKTKVATAAFGKGKGEAKHVNLLVAYEMASAEGRATIRTDELVTAMVGLFDSAGTAIVAAAPTAAATAMVPGMGNLGRGFTDEAWLQHRRSMQAAFPVAYALCDAKLQNYTGLLAEVVARLEREVGWALKDAKAAQNRAHQHINIVRLQASVIGGKRRPEYRTPLGWLRKSYGELADAIKWGEYEEAAIVALTGRPRPTAFGRLRYDREVLRKSLAEFFSARTLDAIDGGAYAVPPAEPSEMDVAADDEEEADPVLSDDDEPEPPPPAPTRPRSQRVPPEKKQDFTNTKRALGDLRSAAAKTPPSKPVKKSRTEVGALAAKAPPRATFTVQIKLDQHGVITDVLTGGRPASPFEGTMGAHSTAWIVHLDHVKKVLVGQPVAGAIQETTTKLVAFADRMLLKLAGLTRAQVKEAFLKKAVEAVDGDVTKAPSVVGANAVLFLQTYLGHLLSYINLIPGVTNEAVDTTGDAEAKAADRLRRFAADPKTADEVIAAIQQLYDSDDAGELWKIHLEVIARAYPDAWALVKDETIEPRERDDTDYS